MNLFRPVHYLSCSYPLLVTAHSEVFVYFWDLRNLSPGFPPTGMFIPEVRHPITALSTFSNGGGFITAHLRGRCLVTFLDQNFVPMDKSHPAKKTFSFRTCQPPIELDSQKIHSVNGFISSKKLESFGCYGGAGIVRFYDRELR